MDTKPKERKFNRYLNVMVLISLATFNFGNYFQQDNVSQLASNFMKRFNIDESQIQGLYSIATLPSIFTALLGGFFVNYVGACRAAMISSYINLIASVFFLSSVIFKQYYLMIIGKVIYGFIEPVDIAQTTLAAQWFNGVYLSLAQGLTQTVNTMGYLSSNFLVPYTFNSTKSMSLSFSLGCFASIFGCLMTIIYANIEENNIDELKNRINRYSESENTKKIFKGSVKGQEKGLPSLSINQVELNTGNIQVEEYKCSYILDLLNAYFIYICLIFMISSQLLYRLTAILNQFLLIRFSRNLESAKNYSLIVPVSAIIFTWIYSIISVRFGLKGIMILVSMIFSTSAYIIFYNLPQTASDFQLAVPFLLLGQFWSIFNAFTYSSVALVCRSRSLALGFSMCLVLNNIAGVILPLWIGKVIEDEGQNSFNKAIWNLGLLSIIGLLFSILLNLHDKRQGGLLFYPENGENVRLLRKLLEEKKMSGNEVQIENEIQQMDTNGFK